IDAVRDHPCRVQAKDTFHLLALDDHRADQPGQYDTRSLKHAPVKGHAAASIHLAWNIVSEEGDDDGNAPLASGYPTGKTHVGVNQIVVSPPQASPELGNGARVVPPRFPTVDEQHVVLDTQRPERFHLRLNEATITWIALVGPEIRDYEDTIGSHGGSHRRAH